MKLLITITFFIISLGTYSGVIHKANTPLNTPNIATQTNQKNAPLSGIAELHELVKKGKSIDTLLGNDAKKMNYCKIGNFLSYDEKNAIVIYNNTIELYTYANTNKSEAAKQNDIITGINLAGDSVFDIDFKDYNFDGQKDIYIKMRCTKAWPMCYGYLITVDKKTKKMERQREFERLANPLISPDSEAIVSDSMMTCTGVQNKQICKLVSKWINGKLVPSNTSCHCQ